MSVDEQHVALPKLYGAPAYARPPRTYDLSPRPLDPDDLPLEAERTDEDLVAFLSIDPSETAGPNGDGRGGAGPGAEPGHLEARPFSIRSLGRILSGRP